MFCIGGIGITSHKESKNFALWSLVLPLSLFVDNGFDKLRGECRGIRAGHDAQDECFEGL